MPRRLHTVAKHCAGWAADGGVSIDDEIARAFKPCRGRRQFDTLLIRRVDSILRHPEFFLIVEFQLRALRTARPPYSWVETQASVRSVCRFGVGRALRPLAWLTVLVMGCSGCERSARPRATDEEIRRALTTYADIAEAGYEDATRGARNLVGAIDGLLTAPSAGSLNAAREAWLSARTPYVQTEVYRFYDGPIDAVELLVNTWPIDEAYVEAPEQGSAPGIIDDVVHYPELTRELMVGLNAKDGETSIATGYHVIEFLLWGRDLQRDGPGARPYTDYVRTTSDPQAAARAERRGRFLKLAAELLVAQLESVTVAWRNQPGTYRSAFLSKPPRDALALAVKGMGSLSGAELAGERLTVAYETKNQENEHSCFSDSTHLDLAGDVQGIQNLCTGRYRTTNGMELAGYGICELVGRYDLTLGNTLAAQIASSLETVRAIPPPFDTAILGTDDAPGRQAIARAIAALQLQTQTLAQAAAAMQLSAPTREAK